MTHQRRECLGVRLARGGGEGRGHIGRAAALVHHPRITLRRHLHPFRYVVRVAVLPRGEPQQDQAQFMRASLGQERIDHAGIELPLLGLELLPVDRDFDRVRVHELHGRPHLRKHAGPAARVVHLRAQNEVRSAIHEQGVAPVFLHQARNRPLLHLGERHQRSEGRCHNHQTGNSSHLPAFPHVVGAGHARPEPR